MDAWSLYWKSCRSCSSCLLLATVLATPTLILASLRLRLLRLCQADQVRAPAKRIGANLGDTANRVAAELAHLANGIGSRLERLAEKTNEICHLY